MRTPTVAENRSAAGIESNAVNNICRENIALTGGLQVEGRIANQNVAHSIEKMFAIFVHRCRNSFPTGSPTNKIPRTSDIIVDVRNWDTFVDCCDIVIQSNSTLATGSAFVVIVSIGMLSPDYLENRFTRFGSTKWSPCNRSHRQSFVTFNAIKHRVARS